ncbi:MAG: hypothetical protein V1798_00950 [Pseudomonadota bacterium]
MFLDLLKTVNETSRDASVLEIRNQEFIRERRTRWYGSSVSRRMRIRCVGLLFLALSLGAPISAWAEERSLTTAYILGFDPIPGDALFYSGHPFQGAVDTVLGGIFGGILTMGLHAALNDCPASDPLCKGFGEGFVHEGRKFFIFFGASGYLTTLIWDGFAGIESVRKTPGGPGESVSPRPGFSADTARFLGWDPIPGDALLYSGRALEGLGDLVLGSWGGLFLVHGIYQAAQGKGGSGVYFETAMGALTYIPALLWDYFGAVQAIQRNAPAHSDVRILPLLSAGPGGTMAGLSFTM